MGEEPGNLRRGGKRLEPPQLCDHPTGSPVLQAGRTGETEAAKGPCGQAWASMVVRGACLSLVVVVQPWDQV